MHLKTRTWFGISLLCFVLAAYFWHLGTERYRRDEAMRATNAEPAIPIKELGADNFHHAPYPPPATTSTVPTPSTLNSSTAPKQSEGGQLLTTNHPNPLLTNRLSNTSK